MDCPHCKVKVKGFTDKMSLDKHIWEYHPSDMFTKHWSELKRNGKLSEKSLAYQDDPYH